MTVLKSHLVPFAFQLIAINWVYGINNFMEDIKHMLGKYPLFPYYWKVTWCFLTPLSVVVSLM